MNVKHALSKILELQGHKRRNTLRYLSKNNPTLWEEMVSLTSFLPGNASAPRRAWHIMNDIYEIPTCPISLAEVGWIGFEHGYKKHSDKRSRYEGIAKTLRETVSRDGHWRHTDPEKARLASKKFSEGFAGGKHKTRHITPEMIDARQKKVAQTCLERYGVDNYRKTKEMRHRLGELLYERHIKNGGTPRELLPAKDAYYDAVWRHTNKSWYDKWYEITDNGRITRGNENHLDHIFSISEGFKNSIPPEIIGHWTNLRLIDSTRNQKKRHRCDKTIEQLYEDFNQRA